MTDLSKRKPYTGTGLQKHLQNDPGKPKQPQSSNLEPRLDCVLRYMQVRKV